MFRFPLWLGLAGAFLPVVTLLEGALPLMLLVPAPIWVGDFEQLGDFWIESVKYSVPVGIVMGLIAVGVCLSRHGRDGSTHAKRFELNLRWCLILALLLIAFNDAVFYVAAKVINWTPRTSSLLVAFFPLILAGVFNFVAVMWAIARTISSEDVLTPRVLMEKVRRSSRLME